jgi:alkanesulfonate monooxygenase SsuD/methylene tetrahydromethanopterin reductase-like flavin-dependent oxidoreductase (luciferase family)
MAEWAESHGCLSVVICEHHASPDGYIPSPLPLAAAMAARTTSIPITVAALLVLLYDPVRLAEDLSVLDHISGGRVMCVVGMGYRPDEYGLYGVDPATRGRRMDEVLALLRRAWHGEPVGDRGDPAVLTPLPATPGGPPLAYGGYSVAAARRAARHSLMFISETAGDHLQKAYEEEAAAHGVAPVGCLLTAPGTPTTVFVAEDVDAAWAELGPRMLAEIALYRGWNTAAGKSGIASLSDATTVEQLRAENGSYRIFTPEQAGAHVRAGNPLALDPLLGGLAPDRAWSYLRTAAAVASGASA